MAESLFQLVLLPGLGADERLFGPQRQAFPSLVVPAWIAPAPRETLPEYAARLAQTVSAPRPLILGGVSLGGMVAYEMARHLRPDALVQIASCRSCRSVRPIFRRLRPVLTKIPAWAIQGIKPLSVLGLGLLTGTHGESRKLVARMYQDADTRFMHWALDALLKWNPAPLEGITTFAIHGRRDRLIPAALVAADEIVPDAGHLFNLTHAREVNAFIQAVAARLLPATTAETGVGRAPALDQYDS
jgi:pimeloyl-ACP methyl ester carboxylesterase